MVDTKNGGQTLQKALSYCGWRVDIGSSGEAKSSSICPAQQRSAIAKSQQ
jgi:hypothetical protein